MVLLVEGNRSLNLSYFVAVGGTIKARTTHGFAIYLG